MKNKTVRLRELNFSVTKTREEIAARVRQIGANLNLDYANKKPVFLAVLNGAYVFTADLVREFEGECEVAFVKLSSYAGKESTGDVATRIGLATSIKNRHVIITEDIVDTGNTMHKFLRELEEFEPASVEIAALLVKPDALLHDISVRYVGFNIPPDFVIGYGLDYDGLGRNLPDIYTLEE